MNASTETSFKSVPEMWHHRVESTPDAESFSVPHNGGWKPSTWRESGAEVRRIANGLIALGLAKGERCGILAATSLDWILSDMAVLMAAGATTTVYPSNTPDECQYILNDCEATVVFCDNDDQVGKLLEVRERLPNLKHVVVFEGNKTSDGFVQTLAELKSAGDAFAKENPTKYDEVAGSVQSDDIATLIYTSGTTGKPKGVMLDHKAWVYEGEAIDRLGIIGPTDKQFLFLPLSHVFAKVMGIISIYIGVPTCVDGSFDRLVQNLGETHPTWMGAVPRVFEKAYNKIVAQAKDGGGLKYKIFKWALATGRQVSEVRQNRKEPTGMLAFKYGIADKLVFSKVREKFGGRLRFFISGGAPLSPEIAEFFHACGILILEGYGLTESSAATVVNDPDNFIFGTVGKPLPGTEVKIDEDGEILLRGPGIMRGYYNLDKATSETLTSDGWLRTGDIGKVLDSGHVKITDRKKEIIVTAGGKNVAPAHFQNKLKARCNYVSQVLMHGDKRNFCTALISINEESVAKWADEQGLSYSGYADLSSKPEVKALIQQAVDALNAELPSYERVKKIALVDEDFSVENGMLTPSMKTKRRIIETRYKDLLDGFYSGTLQNV